MSKFGVGVLAIVFGVVGFALAIVALNGCSYTKPACAAIDLADYACDNVLLQLPDDAGTVAVPREELQRVGLRYLPDAGQ